MGDRSDLALTFNRLRPNICLFQIRVNPFFTYTRQLFIKPIYILIWVRIRRKKRAKFNELGSSSES